MRQRQEAADGRRLEARLALVIIEVDGRGRGHDHVVPLARGRDAALHAAPRHDRGLRRQAALEDLVPADEALAAGVEMLLDAADEPALQLAGVGQPLGLQARLAPRAGVPARLGALVAADVHPGPGKQRRHLVQHVLQESERRARCRRNRHLRTRPTGAWRERPARAGEVGVRRRARRWRGPASRSPAPR